MSGSNPAPDRLTADAMRRFHLCLPEGTLLTGVAAFIVVWNSSQSWRSAVRIARLPRRLALPEAAFRLFLPLRPALTRLAGLGGARTTTGRDQTP
jgi:hypothetical protein